MEKFLLPASCWAAAMVANIFMSPIKPRQRSPPPSLDQGVNITDLPLTTMATISRLKHTIIIVIMLLVVASSADVIIPNNSLHLCGPGRYSYQPARDPEVCIECPDGQFMPYQNHKKVNCFPCTEITDPDKQFEISPCNKTHDARIGRACTEGHYSYNPTFGPDVCVECWDGQFIPYKDHNETSCFLCAEITDKDKQFEISPCNKTHDARIGCTEGYYWSRPNLRGLGDCKECSRCDFRTVKHPCSPTSDTICCYNRHYKLVPKGDGGEICQPVEVICEAGEFVYSEGYTCNSCLPGTLMNLSRHRETSCRPCQKCTDRTDDKTLEVAQCNLTHDTACGESDVKGLPTVIQDKAEPKYQPSTTSSESQDNWKDGLVKFIIVSLVAVAVTFLATAIYTYEVCPRFPDRTQQDKSE